MLRCYLENCAVGGTAKGCIAIVGGSVLEFVRSVDTKTVSVSDAVPKVADEFKQRRMAEVIMFLQRITEREQRTPEPDAGKFGCDCWVRERN